ncbi:hypothetical protein GO491_03045 [Flavobacteriaceae bacterium Ap0902]|nr:hypothetical protein [Flavobacteriaceae bacterium Ap0902]
MRNLFNKKAGNPLMFGLIIPALVPMLLGWSFLTTLSILVLFTAVAIWLNKGLWKGDLIYIAIAFMIVFLGYLFPDFFNAVV